MSPPISSNGSNLKTITIVGGSVMTAEEAARANYRQNQQREKTRPAGTHPMDVKSFGRAHPPMPEEPTDASEDEALQAAIAKDLSDRNIINPTDKE